MDRRVGLQLLSSSALVFDERVVLNPERVKRRHKLAGCGWNVKWKISGEFADAQRDANINSYIHYTGITAA